MSNAIDQADELINMLSPQSQPLPQTNAIDQADNLISSLGMSPSPLPFTNLTATASSGQPVPGTLLGDMNRDGRLNAGEGVMAVGRQFAYGVKDDLPRMLGDMMKYVSEPGGYFYEQGKSITDWVDQQERDNPDLLAKYEWDKNPVMSVLGGGARYIASSVLPSLTIGGLTVLALPASAVTAIGAGGVAAIGVGAKLLTAVPAGMAQGQQTYDKLIAAGVDDETARNSSRFSAAIEWGGESVGNFTGIGKGLFKALGVGGKAAKITGKDAVEYLAKLAEPKTWGTVAGKTIADLAKTMASEVGTEVGQVVGETAVENRAIVGVGGEPTSLMDAAKSVVGPTIGMTLLMAPLGIHASTMDARRQTTMKRAIQDPNFAMPEFRAGAALAVAKDLYTIDPAAADNFAINATTSITYGLPMPLDELAVMDPAQFQEMAFTEYKRRIAQVPVSTRIEAINKEDAKTTTVKEANPPPVNPVKEPVVEPVTPVRTPQERINDALGIKTGEGVGNVLQGQFYTPVLPVARIQQIKAQAVALGWTWDNESASPDGTGTVRIQPAKTMLTVAEPIKPAIPEKPLPTVGSQLPPLTLKAPPNPAVAMYQMAPLKTLGQQQGKQVAIHALDEATFKNMIQPQLATTAMTYDSYRQQFPDHTHVALEKTPGQNWTLAGVGPLAELTKTPLAHPKVYKPVTDFNSTDAIAHSLRAVQDQLPVAPGIRFSGTQAQALEKITGKTPTETPAVFTDTSGTYLVHPKVERKEGVAIGRVQTPGPNKTMTERLFAWDTNRWHQLPTIRDRKVNPAEMVAAAKTFATTHPLAVTKPSVEAKLEGERADTFLNVGKENDNMPVGMHNPTKTMDTRVTDADKQSPQGTLITNNQNALPKFQGNKREMSMPVSKAIMNPDSGWTPAERDRITEGYEPFGGGGSWMLFQATTMFHNLKKITMGELNQVRLDMIAYMHHNGNQFYVDLTKKDEQGRSARDILETEWKRPQMIASGGGLVGRLQKVVNAKTYDKQAISEDQLKLLQIVTDLMPRNRRAIDSAIADVREQVTGLHNMAQDFIKNGGQIVYVQGDAYARDVPQGDHVLTTLDPPYVFTTGYGEQMVGVETYQNTLDLIDKAIKAGNNVIYTDSAWWRTHNNKITTADKTKALDILGAIQNRFDRFQSVEQQIGGHRYEVLGLQNAFRATRGAIEQKPVAEQRKVMTLDEFNAKADIAKAELFKVLPIKVGQNVYYQKSINGKKFKGVAKLINVRSDMSVEFTVEESTGDKRGHTRIVIPEMMSMNSGSKAGIVATKRAVERKTLSPTEKIQVQNDSASFTNIIRLTAPDYYDVNTEAEHGVHAAVKDAWHSIAVEIDKADVTMQQADLDSNITKAELLPRLLAWAQANKDRLPYIDALPKPTYQQGPEIRMSKDPRQQQFNLTPPTPTIESTSTIAGAGLRPTGQTEVGAGSSFVTKLIDDGLTRTRVIADKYSIPNIDSEEKFSIARAALVKAANAYDPATGSDFVSYSNMAIRNALNDSFNKQMVDQTALTSLQQPLGQREATGETVDATLANLIPDWQTLTPDQQAAHRDVYQTVQDAVNALKPSDRTIIDSVSNDRSGVDVAKELGVTPAAVSQRKKILFRNLRAALEAKGINPKMINDLFTRPEASDEIRMSKANQTQKNTLQADNAVVTPPNAGQEIKMMVQAYHGTPHTFEPEEGAPMGKFKKEKVGTGEGAAAYGWGVAYVAENQNVAEQYKNAGEATKRLRAKYGDAAFAVYWYGRGKTERAIEEIDRAIETQKNTERLNFLNSLKEQMRNGTLKLDDIAGNLYHVEVDADPADFLDWDKPLSEQPAKVQQALNDPLVSAAVDVYKSDGNTVETAQDIYHALAWRLNRTLNSLQKNVSDLGGAPDMQRASEYLASLGIKGIRYADQNSRAGNTVTVRLWNIYEKNGQNAELAVDEFMRGVHENPTEKAKMRSFFLDKLKQGQTFNYVVFNESDIRVVGRNGETIKPSDAMQQSKAPDAQGVTVAQALSRVVNWISKQTRLPEVKVIQSIEDAAALGFNDATMSQLRNERPRGFWSEKHQQIIVIADGLDTPERALDVVLHEAVGHFGIEHVLGANYTQAMVALSREISDQDLQNKMRDYWNSLPDQGLDNPLDSDANRAYLTAEIIAERAQTDPTLWAKFVEIVRRALLKMFPGTYVNKWIKEQTNIDALIQASRDFVQSGRGPQATPQMRSMLDGVMMSKAPVDRAVPVLDQPTRDRYIQAMQTYKPDFIPRSWMIARVQPKIDEIGVMNALIKANVDGFPDSDEGAVYAQLLLNTPEFASLFKGTQGQQEMAISLTIRSLEQGSKAGRALAYRRDMLQKPADRQAAILKLLSSPPEDVFKNWSKLTDAQRAVALAEHRANMEKAVAALKKLGITDFTNIDLALLTDNQKFQEVINKISEQMATTGDKIYEYWRNSILSGLQTNMVNMFSNMASATWDLFIQRPLEALVNLVIKDPNAPTFESLGRAYKMLWPHITAANNALRNSWTTETGMFTAADMTGNTAVAGFKGRVIRGPQRGLLAMDEWFKTILTASLAYDYATRAANLNKMSGQDRENFIQWAANDDSGNSAVREDALKEAKRLLFQEKTGPIGTSLLAARNAGGFTGWTLKFIVPFITTPTNLIKIGIKKSPFGLLVMGMNGIKSLTNPTEARYSGPNGKAMLIRDSVEQTVAWAVTGLLYTLTAPGGDGDDDWPKITGSISGSPAEKRFQQLNVPPQSIRIGGRWYSYARIEPFATSLSLIIDALNSFRKVKSGQGLNKDDAKKILSLVRDKTYLQGIGDLIEGIEDPEQWVQMAQNFGSSWTPNILKQALRATDPLQRDIRVREKGFAWLGQSLGIRGAQAALPLADLQPIPKFDHWGRPISKDVGMDLIGQPLSDIAWRMLIPIRVQNVKDETNIDRMIWNYNRTHDEGQWWPGNVRPTVSFRKQEYPMTDQQFERYQTNRGQLAMQMIKRINSWNFDNPTPRDMKIVEAVFTRAGERARATITREIVMQQLRPQTL